MGARPAAAERIVARIGTGGAVLREIMRLDTHFWARRVWVDFRKVSCYFAEPPWRKPQAPRPPVRFASAQAGSRFLGEKVLIWF